MDALDAAGAGRSLTFARIDHNQAPRGAGGSEVAIEDNLVWIDLEMTGLDPARDHVIEIATIVTDSNLNVVAEGPVIAVHQTDEVLERMDEWNRTTHGASGLVERVRASRFDAAEAEARTLEFLAQHARPRGLADVRQQHLPGPSVPGA